MEQRGALPGRRRAVRAALLRLARRRARVPDDVRDAAWTLARETPDFTPLDFAQRYTGTFSEDGRSIAGRWEISTDGSTWELDFALDYIKLS
jgi:hypothetical protein